MLVRRSPTPASNAFLRRLTLGVVVASWLAAAWFLLITLQRTLGPSPVEVEQFWEASRLRRGLPLYVDPLVGAFEDGLPPTRKLVLYTPVWPAFLALLPEAAAILVMRLVVGFGWLFGLPLLAHRALRKEGEAPPLRLSLPVLVAISFASFCLLSRSAWCAAADAPAALIVGYALVRTIEKNRIDPLSAALFAAAPFLKPNVCMISISCFAVEFLRYRHRAMRTLWAAALAGGCMLLFCQLESHGAWLTHLRMSTVQPFLWVKWHEWLHDYFLFLGLPHLVVFATAAFLAVRARSSKDVYALAAAGATWLWSAWLMGKAGAGTHYYLEPTVAMVVLLARVYDGAREGAVGLVPRVLTFVFATVSLVIGVPLFREWARETQAFEETVRGARQACALGEHETSISSNVRMEWALVHRVVIPEYQTSYLTRAGRFPLDLWKGTLLAPEVRCFVLEGDLPEVAPTPVPGRESPSVWYMEANETLASAFVRRGKVGNYTVFIKK